MADPGIPDPHDRFFKEVFSRHEVVRDFIRLCLPDDIPRLLDLDRIRSVKGSFVDEELASHLSDLLFQIPLKGGGSAFAYLLFEHKTSPEALAPFQVLRYMVNIWRDHLKGGGGRPLPPILPVIIYHGRSPWRTVRRFDALFDAPDVLVPYVPRFDLIFWDLSEYDDTGFQGAVLLRSAFLLMKHIYSEDLEERLPRILRLLNELVGRRSTLEYLEVLLRYLVCGAPRMEAEDLKRILPEVFPEKGEQIMGTIAEKWLEEGKQLGIRLGIEKGKEAGLMVGLRDSIIDILQMRFGLAPDWIIQFLNGIDDLDRLKALRRRSLTVESLASFAEVFEKRMEGRDSDQKP